MTQEFHISVTPIGGDDYLVRTERVAPGVPLAEEQVTWPVEDWLTQAGMLMNDPLQGLLRGDPLHTLPDLLQPSEPLSEVQGNLIGLGQQLYNALFYGTIRDSWMTAQGIAQHRQEILRLRLGLKDTRLPRLPWEVLHANGRPIATGTDVVFSRYHSSFAAMASPLQFQATTEADQPLRILMVLAAPTDQEMLALKQEALHLQEELQTPFRNGNRSGRSSDIQLTILEQPGREQLTQALEHNHYQVLHYAGHSNLGAAGGKLYLVSSRTGLTETLSGDDLAGLLVNNGIRMAVFNSCRGVYTATTEPSSDLLDGNLAEALVRRGIPAVLAMAERIPDDVALNLSRLFYRNLKQVYPVDLSLNRARQGLVSSYSSNQFYWALPILYLHPEFDGNLQPLKGTGDELDEPVADIDRGQDSQSAVLEPAPLGGANLHHNGKGNGAATVLPLLEEAIDPEALEFTDPDYPSDMETVANWVNELSHNGASPASDEPDWTPASPSENLLPDSIQPLQPDDYLILPANPAEAVPAAAAIVTVPASLNGTNRSPQGTHREDGQASSPLVTTELPGHEVEMYAELTRMLADSGKLTEAIARCHQTVQANPHDAVAYYRLGLALNEQGYLAEAIAAYQQALRINPTLATVHNQLGLALYQQGNVDEAIRSYDRAIQLDPSLAIAQRNLEVAVLKQDNTNPLTVNTLTDSTYYPGGRPVPRDRWHEGTSPYLLATDTATLPPAHSYARTRTATWNPLLWIGVGAIGLTTLLAGLWLVKGQWLSASLPSALPTPTALSNSTSELQRVSTSTVTALATEELNQGNIAGAQQAIVTLLDRGALTQAAAALTPALSQRPDDPTINFLMGRLAWQSVLAGNKDYAIDDARRYWETAAKQKQSAEIQNALGFAYYTEGYVDRASRAWLKALQLEGAQATPPVRAAQGPVASSPQALNSYAGLTLVLLKSAAGQPPSKQASLQNEAIQLRQKVMSDDPVNFQPDELGKNWMWSESAIRDWRSALAVK